MVDVSTGGWRKRTDRCDVVVGGEEGSGYLGADVAGAAEDEHVEGRGGG